LPHPLTIRPLGPKLLDMKHSMLPCQFADCQMAHVFVPSTGANWHITPLSSRELADAKSTALTRISEPDRLQWAGDLFVLCLIASIEAANGKALPKGDFDVASFDDRIAKMYASLTGGAVLGESELRLP